MRPERWRQIEGLYQAALGHKTTERQAFLTEACAGDEELRREVESMLTAHEQVRKTEDFLNQPALHIAAQAIAENQAESMVGQILGRYQILSLLGRGGMGVVYLAKEDRKSTRLNSSHLGRSYA